MNVDPTIRTAPESAGRSFYQAYLNSPSWRVTRNRALQRAAYRCERCGEKGDLQVHHRNYERLGAEWDQDLEVLCDTCHGGHHEIEKARQGTNPRIYLKIVGAVMRERRVETFSDIAEAVKVECARLKIPYDSARVGEALAIVGGRQKPGAQRVPTEGLIHSTEFLNKGDALRIFSELTEGDFLPTLRSMPSVGASPDERHAHHLRVLEQSRDIQREAYQREARREPITRRLERIFSESPL